MGVKFSTNFRQQKVVQYSMTTNWQQLFNEKLLKFKILKFFCSTCKFKNQFLTGSDFQKCAEPDLKKI
jgi:hypothetical protein